MGLSGLRPLQARRRGASYFVIRLGAIRSLAGTGSWTASSISFSWRSFKSSFGVRSPGASFAARSGSICPAGRSWSRRGGVGLVTDRLLPQSALGRAVEHSPSPRMGRDDGGEIEWSRGRPTRRAGRVHQPQPLTTPAAWIAGPRRARHRSGRCGARSRLGARSTRQACSRTCEAGSRPGRCRARPSAGGRSAAVARWPAARPRPVRRLPAPVERVFSVSASFKIEAK